tara:strand:+ start:653 stop:844 length:192 start_codon:yes stop_codon:yes gene_type:complete
LKKDIENMSKEKTKMSEYDRGVQDCIDGLPCDYNGNADYIDGYADQYAFEQMENENLILKHEA